MAATFGQFPAIFKFSAALVKGVFLAPLDSPDFQAIKRYHSLHCVKTQTDALKIWVFRGHIRRYLRGARGS